MILDKVRVLFASAVGLLCAIAGVWCALTAQLILGALLVLSSFGISGWVWMYLLKVHAGRDVG